MSSPGPPPQITPGEILAVFRAREDPCAPLTATEVAEELDCARRTAYTKLQQLVEQGTLESKKTGARGRVWWRPWPVTEEGQVEFDDTTTDDRSFAFAPLVDGVSTHAIFRLDPLGNILTWNEGGRRITGYTRSEIVGTHVSILYTEEENERGVPETNLAEAAERGVCENEGWRVREDDSWFWANDVTTALYDGEGTLSGFVRVIRDSTEHRERVQTLHQERELVERLFETSPMGVAVLDPNGEIIRANARAEDLLGLTRPEIEGRVYDEPEWSIYYEDGQPIPPDEHPVTRVLETGESVLGFVHGIPLPDGTERWLSSSSAPVFDDDGDIERVIVTLEDITELKTQEREIQRQRDNLEYLDRVNAVIRGVDRAIVAADTQTEIERGVCERIAASDPYLFAVIGGFSSSYNEFTPRVFAGTSEAYLDEMLHAEDAPPLEEGPGATAARTGEVQFVRELSDVPYEFWQNAAKKHSFQSYASIPLVYEDVVYGVLGVYAAEPDAFDEQERAILGELGETIGHAINAIERKEALLAETVVELEFRDDGKLAEMFEEIPDGTDGTVQIDRTVLLDGGDALQYYTVTGIETTQFASALERLSSVERIRVVDRTADTARLEVRTNGPTTSTVIATHGGRIKHRKFGGGEFRVVAEFPYGTNVRQVVDALQAVHPGMELVSRKTRERSSLTVAELHGELDDLLTDRQRAALESGYHAGFFDWPRGSTGEELAETMGVAPSTFHKHLRFGERKILRLLFEERDRSST